MKNFRLTTVTISATMLALTLLIACTPAHDWREVQGSAAPFKVLLPAKPTTLARQIDLDGMPVTMSMTAAEVDGVTYAVGSIELPDAAKAKRALGAMKFALVKNMRGTVASEKAADSTSVSNGVRQSHSSIDIEAVGTAADGRPRLLVARFIAHNQRAYQVVVTGPKKSVSREQVEMFMTSFKME